MPFLAWKFRLQKHFLITLLEEPQSQKHSLYSSLWRPLMAFTMLQGKWFECFSQTLLTGELCQATVNIRLNDTNCGAHMPSCGQCSCTDHYSFDVLTKRRCQRKGIIKLPCLLITSRDAEHMQLTLPEFSKPAAQKTRHTLSCENMALHVYTPKSIFLSFPVFQCLKDA